MKTQILSFALLAVSASAHAGTSKTYPLAIKGIGLSSNADSVRLVLRGALPNGKTMDDSVGFAEVLGKVSSTMSCARYECFAIFRAQGPRLIAVVSKDADQDGNPEARMALPIGAVKPNGEVKLAGVRPSLLLVQDRYTFLEKKMGLKDADYFSLTLDRQ